MTRNPLHRRWRWLLASTKTRSDPATLIRALKAWASTTPEGQPLLQHELLAWSRQQLDDPDSEFSWLPVAGRTWSSVVGKWPKALKAAGLEHRRWARMSRAKVVGARVVLDLPQECPQAAAAAVGELFDPTTSGAASARARTCESGRSTPVSAVLIVSSRESDR